MKRCLLLLYSLIIIVGSCIPGQDLPSVDIYQVDKYAHFIQFFVLGILAVIEFTNKTHKSAAYLICVYGLSFSILTEIIQLFIPGRNFSLFDILFNIIGYGSSILVFRILRYGK